MVLAVAPTPAARLRAIARRIDKDMRDRDDVIVEMRRLDPPATLLEIAQAAGLSIEGVRKILHKRGLR